MNYRIRFTAICMLLLLAAGVMPATANEFSDLMVKANYYCTMALVAASGSDPSAATTPINNLSTLWDKVSSKYGQTPPPQLQWDTKWSGDVLRISADIRTCISRVKSNDMQAVQTDLESVLVALKDLRDRNGIPEMSDQLIAFKGPMDQTAAAAVGTADAAKAAENVRSGFAQLKKQWQRVVAFYDDLPENSLKRDLKAAVDGESTVVSSLDKALSDGNSQAVLESAGRLKPAFTVLRMTQAELTYSALSVPPKPITINAVPRMTSFSYTVESGKSVDQAANDVVRLAAEKGFVVLAVCDISTILKSNGFEQPPMKTVEFCDAKYAHEELQADPAISLILPCVISVYSRNGNTCISAMLPTATMRLFPNANIKDAADALEMSAKQIVDQAK